MLRCMAQSHDTGTPARMELLAPAGGAQALQAALDAGADAVYFGLLTLNARRGAQNFAPADLAHVVRTVHGRGARAYLALNIDLTDRETAEAARTLELARRAGVDAVLVRDPWFLDLRDRFPELEFHWSTQAAVTSRAGVRAAAALGLDRVILARELTLSEVRAAASVPGVAVEVFVQGALCFSVSGRCLLASWVGGRSGNRGTCTSPCRVPWQVAGGPRGRVLSMRDLALVERLDALRKAGVRALKIEGRLKSARWVGRAVAAYRRALDAGPDARTVERVRALGDYAGRRMTAGYLDGTRAGLTGASGRPPSSQAAAPQARAAEAPTYDLTVRTTPKGLRVACTAQGRTETWTLPRTRVRRPEKATRLADLAAHLRRAPVQERILDRFEADEPQRLLPPKNVNALLDRISAALHRARRAPESAVRVRLPAGVRDLLSPGTPAPENRYALGERVNRVRLEAGRAARFLARTDVESVVLEGATANRVRRLADRFGPQRLVAALPSVIFDQGLKRVRDVLAACKDAGVAAEANSWGGWMLAREAGVALEAGPGLGVLNALAARALAARGCGCVAVSVEADRAQMEDLTGAASVPCAVTVFGRPALVVTRAALDWVGPGGALLTDARGTVLRVRRKGQVCVFRPERPFDLTDLYNERVRAQWFVADLCASPDPAAEWAALGEPGKGKLRFNYARRLV